MYLAAHLWPLPKPMLYLEKSLTETVVLVLSYLSHLRAVKAQTSLCIRLVSQEPYFLAHRIRISCILSWDRKSDLTHAIIPRLSRE